MKRAVLFALLLAASVPALAETIVITGGTVALGDGSEPIAGGTVVITDGLMVAAGGQAIRIPANATMIDATGKWVTPGIVAGFSRLGLSDVDAVDVSNDAVASSGPFSAAIDVAPAINPKSFAIAVNRSDGVTRAVVAPQTAKGIFAGQGAMIDLADDWNAVTRARLFQFVELGEAGARVAGGSRASAHVLLRNALREAAELGQFAAPIRSGGARRGEPTVPENASDPKLLSADARRSDDVLLTRFDAAALVPVLRGRQILMIHVERASDILQVISLKREFPDLKLVLVGADEGWTVADRIAAADIAVIASALDDLPRSFETLAATQSNIGRLRAAGVRVSIGMINDNDTRQARLARHYAGNLVALGRVPGASGVPWGEALAMVTSRPAEAMGMGGEIGSLSPGHRGDVVIWSGDPLENDSAAEMVWIDGVRQPLDNRQTKLRDRYRDLSRKDLPEAYRR